MTTTATPQHLVWVRTLTGLTADTLDHRVDLIRKMRATASVHTKPRVDSYLVVIDGQFVGASTTQRVAKEVAATLLAKMEQS